MKAVMMRERMKGKGMVIDMAKKKVKSLEKRHLREGCTCRYVSWTQGWKMPSHHVHVQVLQWKVCGGGNYTFEGQLSKVHCCCLGAVAEG